MKTAKTILFLVFLCGITTIASAQINVVDTKTATDLVRILTNNSPCVIVSEETAKGDSFTPRKKSYGYFDKGTSNFPFSEGIILNTWSATNAIGPFVAGNNGGGSSSWTGDTDLDQTLGINSINASSLEFDFTPLTNFINFNYIFASNEYQYDYPCRFSDAFAFLIKENTPGSTYRNLAIIPDTTTPVSSKNVHPLIKDFTDNDGVVHKGCPPINEKYFNGFNTTTSPINYSGQIVVMNAQTNVIANKNYHIKLVIADDEFKYFDSAIFLQAGSFSPKIDLGADQLLTTNNPVCFGESYLIDTKLPTTYTYKWFKDGSLIPILDGPYPSYTVTDSGTYKVEVTISGTCTATGAIKIEYAPKINLNNDILSKCDDNGNGTATFDLTKAKTDLLDGNTATTTIDYFKTITLSDLILDPSSFKYNPSTGNIVYVNLTIYGTCSAVAEITLQTLPSTVISGICPDPIINAFSGNKNSVELIPPTTGGFYEYSLDGTNYKTSPLFSDLTAGEYTAYIRNSSTCEYLINPFIILDYPRFFTPNNDGYNDTWKIKNLESFPKAILTIFDRYGKLLSQINTINSEWNGKFNGYDLPADDYWFTLNFGVGKITKGHFSLKR